MEIICDLLVILILAGSIYRGYKKGIVGVGYKLIAIIVSLLITLILYSPITYLIVDNTNIDEKIQETIIKNDIKDKEDKEIQRNDSDSLFDKYTKDIANETQKTIVETTAKPIAKSVIGIGVMIILFLISRIILGLVKIFTDIITKIPLLKQINEFAGLVYGLLIGLIIIYVMLAIVFFVASISGNKNLNEVINNTYITKYLYEENLILKLIV